MSNDGNKSTRRVPFTMFSSSADGGYLEDFHTNFTGGVTVANMHTDTYGEFRNPPMQGPFTNEFVGGESFRHQAVGTTTDREEGFEIAASSEQLIITEPTKKPIFRDAFAKRPLNIRNIKENSFGNYEQEYEVIQIAGRTLNPRHYAEYPEQYTTDFAQNFGTEGRVLNDIGADGVAATGSLVAYTLPDNTGSANNFVFVNKFSAPGDRYTMSRGFLNPKGEEMSVYNASPFRNLNVRAELSEDLSRHTPKATNIPPATATSYHNTNRNPRILSIEGYTQPPEAIMTLTSSTASGVYAIALDHYAKKIYSEAGDKIIRTEYDGSNQETVVLTSSLDSIGALVVDHEGGNVYVSDFTTDKIYRASTATTPSTLVDIAAAQNNVQAMAIDPHRKLLYWNSRGDGEIRRANLDIPAGEAASTRTDIEVLQDAASATNTQTLAITSTGNRMFWATRTGEIYTAPTTPKATATLIKSTGLTIKGLVIDEATETIYFSTNLTNTPVGTIRYDGTQYSLPQEFVRDPYLATELDLDPQSGLFFFLDILTTPDNTLYVSQMFSRPVYDNGSVTHSIPRSTLQYSWIKDSSISTRADFPAFATGSDIQFYSNSVGFDSPMNNVYIDPVNASQSFDFTGSVYTYGTWKEIRGGELALSRYYRNNNILPVANNKDSVTQYIEPPVVSKNQPLEYIMAIDKTGAPFSIKSAYGSSLQRYSNKEINKLYNTDVSDSNTEYAKMKPLYLEKSVTDPNNPVKQFYSLNYGETVFPQSKNTYMSKVRVRGNYTEVAGSGSRGYDRLYGTQNTFYSATTKRTSGAKNSQGFSDSSLAFDPMRTDGSDSFPMSGLSSTLNVGEVNFNSAASLTSKVSARPSLNYSEANSILVGTTNSDYTERLVEQMSGKKRWYDSYSDYEENIRGLLKDASILPEFRVSEHMDYYVDTSAGNFRAENKKFLTLLGAEYSSSADSRTSNTFDVNFEDTYLDTENIKNLEKIRQDHIGYASPKKLTIKASGIKKLLPYNGFYPDTRTVQLGNLLSQSLADNISGYEFEPGAPSKAEEYLVSSPKHGYAAVLKTLASPGILYNSTKAGLAVDYPIYSSTPELKTINPNPLNQSVISSSSQPTSRLPFETLINFNENLPKDEKIFLVATSPSGSTLSGSKNYYGKWNGIKKPNFEIATHNYLAESVNFFLDGGQLNTFTSKPQLQFSEVEANKIYYMDVALRDEARMNRFIEYGGLSASFPTYEIVDQEAGLLAVSGSELAKSTATVALSSSAAYTLYGDPSQNRAILLYTDANGTVTNISNDPDGNPVLTGSFNSDARYGESVAMSSGSDGLIHFVVGAPSEVRKADYTGSISHYYLSTTASVIEFLTSSLHNSACSGFGTDVDIVVGTVEDGTTPKVYYTAIGHTATSSAAVPLAAYRYQRTTPVTALEEMHTHIPAFSGSSSNQLCLPKVAIASGSFRASIGAISNFRSGSEQGTLSVYDADFAGPDLEEQKNTIVGHQAESISATSIAEYFYGPSFGTGFSAYGDNMFFGVGGVLSPDSTQGRMTLYRYHPQASTPAAQLYSTSQTLSYNSSFGKGFSSYNDIVLHSVATADTTGDGLQSAQAKLYLATPYRDTEDIPIAQQVESGQPNQLIVLDFDLPDTAYEQNAASLVGQYQIDPKPGVFSENPYSFGQGVSIAQHQGYKVISCGQPIYNNFAGDVHLIYRAPRQNTLSQHGKLFGVPTETAYDPAFCAYTPPGFYGESVATIAFSSSIGGEISLDEIIRSATVTEVQNAKPGNTSVTAGETTLLKRSQQDIKMNVGSSITLFAKSEQPDLQFEIGEDGEAVRVDRATTGGANNIRWAISTKYETPVIDVSSSAYEANYTSHVAGLEANLGFEPAGRSYALPQSPWTSYGQQTTPEKGYYFDVRESTSKTSADGSLIDLCGFTPGTKKLGSVADNKVITEAIMVIPYTDRAISRKTTEIEEGKHFFRVNMAELKRQNKSLDNNGYAVSEEIPETSIAEMISGMKDYVIPPQYNFMQYKDIKPFAAYFLEFTHTLSQRDLIDIWQGVTPSIALNPETEDVEISHNFDKHNLFHNIDIPADMKFMVFKVKKKANWNYYTITADSTDDDRFKFDFQGDGQVEVVPDYNYNWPYDFFTLVERAKVDVTVSLEKDNEPEENE